MINGSIELRRNFNKHLIMFITKIFHVHAWVTSLSLLIRIHTSEKKIYIFLYIVFIYVGMSL